MLTLHDSDYEEIDHYDAWSQPPDILDDLIYFHHVCVETCRCLLSIWHDKARTLFELKLERLTLDFSNAYGPDGEFLGLKFARKAPKFRYGIPRDLEIIAHSQTVAKGIEFVIRAINT